MSERTPEPAYRPLLAYVGTYDFAVFLNHPEIDRRLRELAGPYYPRVTAFREDHERVQFDDRYFVLRSDRLGHRDHEDVMVVIDWQGEVCAGLRRPGWARMFCRESRPDEYLFEPTPLRLFVAEAFDGNLLKDRPRETDFAIVDSSRESWAEREKRLGPIDPADKVPR